MRVLITGATGLIGSKLVSLCHAHHIDVSYLTTSKGKIEDNANYKGFYWNPAEGIIDERAFEGVSTVVNLAGATISKRWTDSYKKTILESRTQTANILFETLREIDHNVGHFVSASGINIYPNSKTRLYTEENKDIDASFLAEVVLAWEASADQFKALGMDVSKVRTGVVLAKEEGALPKLMQPITYGLGASLGSGKQWQSWIHIDDIAHIYLQIIHNQWEGIYNAVAPTPVTNKKLTRKIASILQKPIWLPNVPGFLLKLVLGEMATLVLEGQLVSSRKLEERGYRFQYYNVEGALQNLLN